LKKVIFILLLLLSCTKEECWTCTQSISSTAIGTIGTFDNGVIVTELCGKSSSEISEYQKLKTNIVNVNKVYYSQGYRLTTTITITSECKCYRK
jgi:hypothetical protein